MSFGKLIAGVLVAAIGYVALSEVALASPSGGSRKKVVGKSRHTWFVATDPGKDPGSVTLTVFDSATSNAPIIEYRQVIETGQRFLLFQAPTSLAKTAIADFI